ncbi:5'/3'-nucleotidase SurE [Williamsia sp. M5A3_1d]
MSLRILLTNDDGWQAPGITALAEGLRGAGHTVTVVAPSGNQSGASARLSAGRDLTVTRPDGVGDVWSVEGSPADSVIFGLSQVFADAAPDIVVSGANAGANAGQAVHFSGTVGAAVTAASFGVPAVAVSTDLPWATEPERDQFDATTKVVVALLGWAEPRRLVADGTVLNVNVPAPEHDAGARLVATTPDRFPMGRIGYTGDGPDYALTFEPGPEPLPGTDVATIRGGDISLSIVPVSGHLDAEVAVRLERLADADITWR